MTSHIDVPAGAARTAVIPRRWAQAVATATCTGIVIIVPKSAPVALRVALVLLGTLGAIDLSRRESHAPGDPRPIAWSIAGLFTLGVAVRPKFATDIWSYTMVGRILAAHHLNPYRVAPAAMRHDPLLPLLHHTWRSGTTPYGPLAVLHAASIAVVAGTHPLIYRIAFQATAAIAIGAALYMLWRATHSTAALALVGLHPVIAGSIVNGGHNDAVVAFGLLALVLLLAEERLRPAGWVLLATILVKLTILYAVVPIVVWTAVHYGRRALRPLLAPTAAGVVGMALIPGAVHSMTNANGGIVTRLAIWNVFRRVTWLGVSHVPAGVYAALGLLIIAALGVYGGVAERNEPDPGAGAAIGAAAWVAMASYALAWYTSLGLVAAALRPTSRIARWLAVQGGVITAAFLIPRLSLATHALLGDVVQIYVPIALTAAFVAALVNRRTSPIPTE